MYKILVVEDEKNIRFSIQEILLISGYEVELAENGLVAMNKLKEQKFDLILCDVMMPEMDGFELLAAMKKRELFDTPFIFLTAKAQYDDLRAGMNLGADDYIFKPFKSKDLIVAIESRISKKDKAISALLNKSQELEKTIELMVGHEFNTPMNGILSLSQMIRENAKKWNDAELTNFCDYLDKSSKRLQGTFQKVKMLLELQKGNTNINSSELSYFEAGTVISTLSKEIAASVHRSNDLQISITEEIKTTVDEELFTVLFREIIENAFKFTDPGEEVVVCTSSLEGVFTVNVSDNGKKTSVAELSKYESFNQFNRNKYEQQGLGVGLAIVKSIVGLYKGELILTDNIPTGINVTIKLKL